MDIIWAPWRMEYIAAKQPEGCIFCDKAAEELDEQNLILYRGELVFIMLNAFPYNNGHMMVAPYRHVGDISVLTDDEMLALMKAVTLAKETLAGAFSPQGFNIGINLGRVAGAGIEDHVHIHVVPRWNGDTNFMPVMADVRVMPQSLSKTYAQLKEAIDELRGCKADG